MIHRGTVTNSNFIHHSLASTSKAVGTENANTDIGNGDCPTSIVGVLKQKIRLVVISKDVHPLCAHCNDVLSTIGSIASCGFKVSTFFHKRIKEVKSILIVQNFIVGRNNAERLRSVSTNRCNLILDCIRSLNHNLLISHHLNDRLGELNRKLLNLVVESRQFESLSKIASRSNVLTNTISEHGALNIVKTRSDRSDFLTIELKNSHNISSLRFSSPAFYFCLDNYNICFCACQVFKPNKVNYLVRILPKQCKEALSKFFSLLMVFCNHASIGIKVFL